MMAAASEAIVRVLSAGLGATLQDAGRHGYLRFGVTAAGPMDALAHATATSPSAIPRARRRWKFPWVEST